MKPFWPPTLQLLPVHLQASDAYAENLLAHRMVRSSPNAHGIVSVTVDEPALSHGELVVRQLEAVFPSGAIASTSRDTPIVRRVTRSAGDVATPQPVYVGLPAAVLRGPNVSQAGGSDRSTRYVSKLAEGSRIPSLEVRAEILFGSEVSNHFEVLVLGSLERAGTSLRFNPQILPTALRIKTSARLVERLSRLLAAMESRRQELLRYRAEHPLKIGSVPATELPGLQLAVLVGRYMPLLTEVERRRSAHPKELYDLLVAIYGALAPFGAVEPPPPYLHEDQAPAFWWLFDQIQALVDQAARDRTTIVAFERLDHATFRATLSHGDLVGKQPILVAGGADETFLRERIPSILKMASPTAIAPLLNSAVRGVAIAVEFEPPSAIPRTPDVVAYRIDVRSVLWLDIEDRLQIQLHVPHAPPSLKFALYGVERPL
jgi:type VI secretion system protein ImpJ